MSDDLKSHAEHSLLDDVFKCPIDSRAQHHLEGGFHYLRDLCVQPLLVKHLMLLN